MLPVYNGHMAPKQKGIAKKTKKRALARVSAPAVRSIGGRGTRTYKLDFVLPPDLPLLYVDNVNVVHTPSEFIVSFLQSQPPLFVTDEQLESTDSIPSRVVARIVVNPLKMNDVVRTLMENFQLFVQTYMKGEERDGKDKTAVGDANASRESAHPKRPI